MNICLKVFELSSLMDFFRYQPYNPANPIALGLTNLNRFHERRRDIGDRLLGIRIAWKRLSCEGGGYGITVAVGGIPAREYVYDEDLNVSEFEKPTCSAGNIKVSSEEELQKLFTNEARSIPNLVPHVVVIINNKIWLTPSEPKTIDQLFT